LPPFEKPNPESRLAPSVEDCGSWAGDHPDPVVPGGGGVGVSNLSDVDVFKYAPPM
jgi:hypothetical protein